MSQFASRTCHRAKPVVACVTVIGPPRSRRSKPPNLRPRGFHPAAPRASPTRPGHASLDRPTDVALEIRAPSGAASRCRLSRRSDRRPDPDHARHDQRGDTLGPRRAPTGTAVRPEPCARGWGGGDLGAARWWPHEIGPQGAQRFERDARRPALSRPGRVGLALVATARNARGRRSRFRGPPPPESPPQPRAHGSPLTATRIIEGLTQTETPPSGTAAGSRATIPGPVAEGRDDDGDTGVGFEGPRRGLIALAMACHRARGAGRRLRRQEPHGADGLRRDRWN